MMKFFNLFLFTLIWSCQPQNSSLTSSMQLEELLKLKGEPKSIKVNKLNNKYTMYNYDKEESYQVEGKEVVARFRNPKGNEAYIQYWYKEFEDQPFKKHFNHNKHSTQGILTCSSCGKDIVYNPKDGVVERIVEYKL